MKRFAAFLLIVTGLFLVLSAIGFSLYSQALSNPAAEPLPDQLAGLALVQQTTGFPAVNEINQLHRKEFPLTSASVGMYGAEHVTTLWVSGVPGRLLANRILVDMRERIAEGRSPFSPTGERKDGRRIVYSLEGMGQRHFYFQSGNLVIWLAADEGVAEQALEQTLAFYP